MALKERQRAKSESMIKAEPSDHVAVGLPKQCVDGGSQPPQPTMFLITTSNYKSSNVPCFFTMFFDVSGPDWPTPCFFDHVFHVSGPFLVRIGQHHVFLTMFFEQKALCGSCRG